MVWLRSQKVQKVTVVGITVSICDCPSQVHLDLSITDKSIGELCMKTRSTGRLRRRLKISAPLVLCVVGMGQLLDLVILEVFSNFNDSMILWHLLEVPCRTCRYMEQWNAALALHAWSHAWEEIVVNLRWELSLTCSLPPLLLHTHSSSSLLPSLSPPFSCVPELNLMKMHKKCFHSLKCNPSTHTSYILCRNESVSARKADQSI